MKIETVSGRAASDSLRPFRLELENAASSGVENTLNLDVERAVALSGDVDHVLEEFACPHSSLECLFVEEVVLAPVLLTGTARAGRCRDRHLEIDPPGDERTDQRSLAGARWPGDDEQLDFRSTRGRTHQTG